MATGFFASTLSIAVGVSSFAFAASASAQVASPNDTGVNSAVPMSADEIKSLAADLQSGPIVRETSRTFIDEDGVETVVNTRFIGRRSAVRSIASRTSDQVAPTTSYVALPSVYDRQQWLAECQRRTAGLDDNDRGKIIGGLLGAVAGGFLGNRIDGGNNRIVGTAAGAGLGALAGASAGDAIDDRNDEKRAAASCEDLLNAYMSSPQPATRYARRSIAAPAASFAVGVPAYVIPAGAPCNCAPEYAQETLVPVETTQRRRVIVRESVSEEMLPLEQPRVRAIPPRAPAGKLIPASPKVVPVGQDSTSAAATPIKK